MSMRTSRRSVLSGLGAAAFAPPAHAANANAGAHDVRLAPVRSKLQAAIAQGHAVGLAVAVAHKSRLLWAEGFGWADRERRIRATERTPFSLASISKPFTATAAMILARM